MDYKQRVILFITMVNVLESLIFPKPLESESDEEKEAYRCALSMAWQKAALVSDDELPFDVAVDPLAVEAEMKHIEFLTQKARQLHEEFVKSKHPERY